LFRYLLLFCRRFFGKILKVFKFQQLQAEVFMAKIRPLSDRVLVKRVASESKSTGGIVIPDTAQEKPIIGEVIAVGNGKVLDNGETRKPDVAAGDRILFGKYSGTEVKIDGEQYLMMKEDDINTVASAIHGLSRHLYILYIVLVRSTVASLQRTVSFWVPAYHLLTVRAWFRN
jgi:chaperonin GroES